MTLKDLLGYSHMIEKGFAEASGEWTLSVLAGPHSKTFSSPQSPLRLIFLSWSKHENWKGTRGMMHCSGQTFHHPVDRIQVVPEILTLGKCFAPMLRRHMWMRARRVCCRRDVHHRKLLVKAKYFLSRGPIFPELLWVAPLHVFNFLFHC
jgi:hypothetical protein